MTYRVLEATVMNGQDLVKKIEEMDVSSEFTHEGNRKVSIKFQRYNTDYMAYIYTDGWIVSTMYFDKIEYGGSTFSLHREGRFVGCISGYMAGVI